MSLRLIVIIAGMVGLVWLGMNYVNQGDDLKDTKGQLADSTAKLGVLTKQNFAQYKHIWQLQLDSTDQMAQILQLKLDNAKKDGVGRLLTSGIKDAYGERDRVLRSYNKAQLKKAADESSAEGAVETTEEDSLVNERLASVQRKYKYVNDTIVPKLVEDRSAQQIRADKAEEKAKAEGSKVSDLEKHFTEVESKVKSDLSANKDKRNFAGINNKRDKRRLEKKVLSRFNK